MRLTDEMIVKDDRQFAQCNVLAELKFCGFDIPHRKSITNDEIHFYAWLFRSAVRLLKSKDEEIERLKAQKQKWLQNIADQQLAVSPTGYETEEGLAKRNGEWNGLQMAWEILTKE